MERTKTKENHSFGLPDIGIPSEVLFHPELTHTEKILFGFLRNLSQSEKGCWASNKWLGGLIGVKGQTISNSISKLKECEYILVEYEQMADGRQVRRIFINPVYPQIYRKLVIEAYKNINSPLLENLFPSIKKIIHPYKKTLSKIDKEKVNKEVNKNKKNSLLDNLPKEWIKDNSFQNILQDFIEHRKEKHQPITPRAGTMLANKLSKFSMQVVINALQASIENGWTGVFPENGNGKKSKSRITIGSGWTGQYDDPVYEGIEINNETGQPVERN